MASEVQLYSWGGHGRLASVDPHCLAVQTMLRIRQINFTVTPSSNPLQSPSLHLPVLFDDDKIFSGPFSVMRHLVRTAEDVSLEADRAFSALVEETLHDCWLHSAWNSPKNYEVMRGYLSSLAPFPYRHAILSAVESHVAARTQHLVPSTSAPPPPPTRHVSPLAALPSRALTTASECFETLAARLGASPYFGGDSPNELDAIVYGHVAVALYLELPEMPLKTALRSYSTLEAHIERVGARFFGDWQPEVTFASPLKTPRAFRRGDDAPRYPGGREEDDDGAHHSGKEGGEEDATTWWWKRAVAAAVVAMVGLRVVTAGR